MGRRSYSQDSDAELLGRFLAGRDEGAFAEIVMRHGPLVKAVARRVLGSAHDVEDAFQATFMALARSASKIRRPEALAGWLHEAAVRCAKQIQRSNAAWQSRLRCRGATSMSAVSPRELEELRTTVDSVLRTLPAHYRSVVIMCDLEGLSRGQAAQRMGIPVSTVRSRLSRGRELLRSRLVRRGVVFTASLACHVRVNGAISSAIAHQTARRATVFAANPSAANLGVSSLAAQTAQKVISTMALAKVTKVITASVLITLFMATAGEIIGVQSSRVASASTILFDDFADGQDPTLPGREPVPWNSSTAQSLTIETGSFRLAGSGTWISAMPAGIELQDVSVRTQVLADGDSYAVLIVRQTPGSGDTGYWAGIDPAGVAEINTFGTNIRTLAASSSAFDPHEPLMMQLDAIGNVVSLYVWRPGEVFPLDHPAVTVVDDSVSGPGAVHVGFVRHVSGALGGVFDFVQVADASIVPEPSMAMAAGIALVTLLSLFRGSRRRDP